MFFLPPVEICPDGSLPQPTGPGGRQPECPPSVAEQSQAEEPEQLEAEEPEAAEELEEQPTEEEQQPSEEEEGSEDVALMENNNISPYT